jgi:hypothetical protein
LDRELPVRFVQHAIQTWQAHVVAFLMPERCRKVEYQQLLPEGYEFETLDLAHSTFYFRGIPVQQPSILQIFWKKSN